MTVPEMPRRRRERPFDLDAVDSVTAEAEPEVQAAAEAMGDWAKRRSAPKRRRIDNGAMARIARDAERMMHEQDWAGATGKHFVALYLHLHLRVYGVEAAEVGPTDRVHAACAAARMLEKEFDGDGDAMADFMRWCWQREAKREKWRRENKREGGRIGWRLQFGGTLLTDRRLDLARRRTAP